MYLAVDIGGTKTLVALFSKRGRIIKRQKFKTAWKKERFLNELEQVLMNFTRYNIVKVAVAVPGYIKTENAPYNPEQKICSVRFGNRDWGWFFLSPLLEKLFSCSVYFENDANLAAIYESTGISGRTMFLTFSTGIGGGIARDGVLEKDDFEPGHIIYEYNGKKAEWEDIAAASAIEKFYHVDRATDLRKHVALRDVGKRIGLGLPDMVKDYAPDTIVIGGPIGKIFRLFAKYLPRFEKVKYRRPKRPLESVIYGCYLLCKNQK